MEPGGAYKDVIFFTAVVDATIEEFDAELFKTNLAATLPGISRDEIALTVIGGSLNVSAAITTPSDAVSVSTVATLSSIGAGALSAALGVSIEALDPPRVQNFAFSAPSPPPPSVPLPPAVPPPSAPFEAVSGSDGTRS